MICFPHAKINLGLAITEKRADGFHNLETCFYPIPLHDVLEFTDYKDFDLLLFGNKIEGLPADNLLSRVWRYMHVEYKIPPIRLALLKNIPSGAGLGGGSSDAAFLVSQLNTHFKLGLTMPQMERVVLRFGSDCPFFVRNRAVIATGRGEIMKNISLSLSGYYLTVVFPGYFISTAIAFQKIKPQKPTISIAEVLAKDISHWRDELKNDFQPIAIDLFPGIGEIIQKLYDDGAIYAGLSGSGSAVFALSNLPINFLKTSLDQKVFSWKL